MYISTDKNTLCNHFWRNYGVPVGLECIEAKQISEDGLLEMAKLSLKDGIFSDDEAILQYPELLEKVYQICKIDNFDVSHRAYHEEKQFIYLNQEGIFWLRPVFDYQIEDFHNFALFCKDEDRVALQMRIDFLQSMAGFYEEI